MKGDGRMRTTEVLADTPPIGRYQKYIAYQISKISLKNVELKFVGDTCDFNKAYVWIFVGKAADRVDFYCEIGEGLILNKIKNKLKFIENKEPDERN
jgi:hypothetical protein